MLSVVGVIAAGAYLYLQLDGEARRYAEEMLSEKFPHLEIEVGSARVLKGKGLLLQDIDVSNPEDEKNGREFITIDEIFIASKAGIKEIVQGNVKIDRFVIRRPKVRLAKMRDGSWNLSSVLPMPKAGSGELDVVIEGGQLEYYPVLGSEDSIVFRDISGTLNRPALPDAKTAQNPNGNATPTPKMVFDIAAESSFFSKIHCTGEFHKDSKFFSATGSVQKLNASHTLFQKMIPKLASVEQLAEYRGQLSFNFGVKQTFSSGTLPKFTVTNGTLANGVCSDPRLPRKLTDLSGSWSCNNKGLTVQMLTGRFGSAAFSASFQKSGWTKAASVAAQINTVGLELDAQLVQAFPKHGPKMWASLQPIGSIDTNSTLYFNGTKWINKKTVVTCRDVAFVPEKFPYRLKNGKGVLTFAFMPKENAYKCNGNLIAFGRGQAMNIDVNLTHLGPNALGTIRVAGNNIPIDSTLTNALQGTSRRLAVELRPTGKLDAVWSSHRASWKEPINYSLDVKLHDCTVKYDHFPYPLLDISGKVKLKNRRWTFTELKGSNNGGLVTGFGEMVPNKNGGKLTLTLQGNNIALEEDLRKALPNDAAKMWEQMQPRGRFNGEVTIVHETGMKKPHIIATAFLGNTRGTPGQLFLTSNSFGQAVSIEPSFFPYRFEQIDGRIDFSPGKITMHNMKAKHGQAKMYASGECFYGPDGSWQTTLRNVIVDRLFVDHDFLRALPKNLSDGISDLRPQGQFNLRNSTFFFQGGPRIGDSIIGSWNINLGMHQVSIEPGVLVSGLYGEISLAGQSNAQGFFTDGELNLDSMTFKGFQFTQVKGPFWANHEFAYFGKWATAHRRQPEQKVTARAYGGQLEASGRVKHSGDAQYFTVEANLQNGNVADFAIRHFPNEKTTNLQGRVNAKIQIGARGKDSFAITRSLKGFGDFHVDNAKIYQLPQIVKMLNVLRVREPSSAAFTDCDAKFRIDGEFIHFDDLELKGDTINMKGKGTLQFNQRVNMVFQTLIGIGRFDIPYVKKILRQASGQFVQLNVRGTIQNPTFVSEPLPGLNKALQTLGAGFEPTSRSNAVPRNVAVPIRGTKQIFGPPVRQ